MILFVFEGAEREPRVFRTLERLFFGQGERIVCSFGNNIYELYRQLHEWVKGWRSEDEKTDAEDLLSEEFGYVSVHKMTSSSSSLWKESTTSLGTIAQEPDADGFFVLRPKYEDTDHLCVLLKRRESPSLYRGMLV